MILTSLIDNTRLNHRTDLTIERGLSIHVSTMGKSILFDAGSSSAFCDNAALLNVDIKAVDAAVISHRHHDHCNGVNHFIDNNSKAQVYFRECDKANYVFKAFGFKSNVGINKQLLTKATNRLTFVNQLTEIFPNIFIITNLVDKYPKPKGNKYLFTDSEGCCKPDTFDHELLLVIKEADGLVVFTGCAHSGVLNMIETAVNSFPTAKIKAVVGGFHLVGLPLFNSIGGTKQQIEEMGKLMLNYPIDKLYTGHCTGMKAYNILKGVLGERLEYFPTGRSINI
ncbi:beta-lactamase domain protein [Shewanella halifaxensis HAW-EB4]|uniref:Beta-lactamase domain protein n=1 Tax=Shewanella halifaxensis (strain HAW-EB4) TaxID=458817 RepID=B0TUJ0_SHEHH|nr:MBL fold metallo-hydrolase [Shewanella halifaxensis]ABZ76718.1 beta-lactamase domain protein [Shewanella halifaxensis HAW-EB4]